MDNNEKELQKRKPTRAQGFNYNSAGAYFITICTENRRQILSNIVGVDVLDDPFCDILDYQNNVELTNLGKIADKYINQINDFYEDIKIDRYVIMPNHIHIMLFVFENGSSRTSTPTRQHSVVSRFVSTFKRFCNKEYGKNIWQRHFNDHVIRNREDYEEHIKYIHGNPAKWVLDELYTQK